MRRREFIAGLGSAAAWPVAARAQQTNPTIGVLSSLSDANASLFAALRQGLGSAGYVEGRNVALLFRSAENRYDQFPALATDLVDHRVNVIVTTAPTNAALAAKAATSAIPIVFATASDPVAVGLVASLNRPGGNITGTTFLNEQLNAKRLEILRQTVPGAATIAYLFNPNTFDDGRIGRIQASAHALGVGLTILNAATPDDIETVFAEIALQRIGAMLVDPDPMFYGVRDQLVALATQYAVPTMYQTREHVAAGGLISYAADILDALRLVGIYTGRILKGEKPADLPVQQSTKVVLAINMKTAKALGLTVPEMLLATADEVIQ
jgi:putative ABC transport system substrate-binding protein